MLRYATVLAASRPVPPYHWVTEQEHTHKKGQPNIKPNLLELRAAVGLINLYTRERERGEETQTPPEAPIALATANPTNAYREAR